MKRGFFGLLIAAMAFAAAAPAYAQGGGASSTGTIQGRVTDAQGAVLPGVTVTATSAALIVPQTTVTSETGNYRFPAVPPGTYTVTYELTGFNTVKREGISIALGFTANLNVELALATLQETVTVTGESPVIDTSATRVVQNFKLEQLQSIPNARDMWSLLAVTPAVQMTRIDVGGNRAGTQTGYSAYGFTGQVRVLIEGINTTEGTGGAGFYFDYSSLEEVFLGTTGQSAEMPNPGVQSQFIAKSGGNQFNGEYYFDWYNGSLQGSNIPTEYTVPTAFNNSPIRAGSNEIDRYYDTAINAGGPIKRDKVWWFGTYRTQFNAVQQPNFLFDSTFNTKLWNPVGKVTYQLNQNHKLIGYYQWGQKFQPNRLPFATAIYQTPGPTFKQDSGSWVWKGEWNGTLSDKLYVEARVGSFGYYFPTLANSDEEYFWRDSGTLEILGAHRRWQTDRERNQYTAAGTYFLDTGAGSHTIKLGGEILREKGWVGFEQGVGGDIEHIYNNGNSNQVIFRVPTATSVGSLKDGKNGNITSVSALNVGALFLNDTWNLGRMTLNAGVRYDRYTGWLPEQQQLPFSLGPVNVPARTFDERDLYTWNLFAPRVGVIFDVAGDGRTVIKGNYGFFWHNPGVGVGDAANENTSEKAVTYNWTDTNRDRRWQPGEQTTLVSSALAGGIQLDPDIKARAAGRPRRLRLQDRRRSDLEQLPARSRTGRLHAGVLVHRHRARWFRQHRRRADADVLWAAGRGGVAVPDDAVRDERRSVLALQDVRSGVHQALRQSLVGVDRRRAHLADRLPERSAAQPEQSGRRGLHAVELQGHGQLRRGVRHPHLAGAAPPVGRELRAHADDHRAGRPGRHLRRRRRQRRLRRADERQPRGQHLGVRHARGEDGELHRSPPHPVVPRPVQHHQQPRVGDDQPRDGPGLPEAVGDPGAVHRAPRIPATLVRGSVREVP
jgi:hypothetical protein